MYSINNFFLCLYVFCLINIIDKLNANEVLGCGGFIKSHAPIDFDKIEVKLFTKQHSLKDSTFCAPNNGYYFLPLYDKGDYYLKIHPPTGWSFMPKEVHIHVDGKTDLCSQGKDINFVFEGFGITGQVDNVGGGIGPKGVKIQLTGSDEIRETTTNDQGTFYFTPVYPGTYEVTVSHPKWKFLETKHTVQVASENTELPKNSFLIVGYDVTGSVLFEHHPMANIDFILFNDSDQPVAVDGCTKSRHPNFLTEMKYLCYVTSDEKGAFTFPILSPGSYRLVPFYQKLNMLYHIHPEELRFSVIRDSLVLDHPFEVASFSLSGRVLTHVNGRNVEGAIISVNEKHVTNSNTDGTFLLEKLASATYIIGVEASDMHFENKIIKVNPSIEEFHLDLIPSAFQVCGNVASEKSYTVVFKHLETQNVEHRIETNSSTGDFCTYLPTGNYSTYVATEKESELKTTKEQVAAVQFFPITQLVNVNNAGVKNVNFSQLRAKVTGTVKCLEASNCAHLSITMVHMTHEGNLVGQELITSLKNGKDFIFNDVVPGTYQITLAANKYCWQTPKHIINVNSESSIVPDFIQTGYTIIFLSSHNTEIQYKLLTDRVNNEQSTKTIQIHSGRNVHCVDKFGTYEMAINSCHLYENSVIKFNTNSDINEIILTALKHLTSVEISSPMLVKNLNVSILTGGITTQTGPLNPEFKGNSYYYRISIHLSEKQEAVLTPLAESLWFKPSTLKIVGTSDCVDHGVKIMGLQGKVIQGRISPPLAGVTITVQGSDNGVLVRETDVDGSFRFPTLDNSFTYVVTASKDSYTFSGPDSDGNFKAHKLAEIIITVVDQKDDSPLQGALISLSGADSYRSNLQTNIDGTITFSSLSPSDYFMRPMMKEYNFEPSSKIISIEEGATVYLKLSGQRVAYSAYGYVSSLNGESEDKIVVIADGIETCSQYSEEATTEKDGQFRIRGLHPDCTYEIRVKESLDRTQQIERAVPESITLQIGNNDVTDLKLIALPRIQNMDVIVQIATTKLEHFKTLRLKLNKESVQNNPIYSLRLDPTQHKSSESNVLIHLPSIPIDNKTYYLKLESTLSQTAHYYKTDIESFVANTAFKFITLKFSPETQVQDQDIGHISVMSSIFIIIILFIIYNIQLVTKFVMDFMKKHNLMQNFTNFVMKGRTNTIDRTVDNDEIDQIVQNINAVKRKVRPRKI